MPHILTSQTVLRYEQLQLFNGIQIITKLISIVATGMSTELREGTTLQNGKYTIVRSLGQGSFGITYLATTKFTMKGQLGQMDTIVNVAIKEFFMSEMNSRANDGSSLGGSSGSLFHNYQQKFRKEAENLSRLDHPNIVKVLEVFDENNTTYYVMQYIDGESLDSYILRQSGLTEQKALSIIKEVGNAVQYMHSNKMLHLDLKPKNVMLDKDGKNYLIDFGLSKQYTDNGEPESSTKVGAGTPGYAPIEQANYREGKGFPVTMDVYALGGTLFKMLTGKRPPEASEILNDGFPFYELQEHDVNDALSASVAKAMAPIKKDRFQSVIDFLNAIDNEEEATIVDFEFGEKNRSKETVTGNTADPILKVRKDTRKVRIEYYPSVFSGKEEYIREITNDSVRYMHGHNLDSPFQKVEEKWSKYSISREKYEKFLTNLGQLQLRVNPDGNDREEWGTDNTRLKIVLYDEQNKEYNTIWKYSWADEYGGGESGKLEGSPIEIYERIISFLPQEDKKSKSTKSPKVEERNSKKEKKEPNNKEKQDEKDLRQLVEHMKECEEYKEAYKTCLQYIKEGRCKSVAQELSQELVPMMKKQNQRQNRKQVVIVTVVTIIVMILSILLNSLR